MVILFYGFPSHDGGRRLPHMLTDVQKAGRPETSASQRKSGQICFKICNFVNIDETWLQHFDPESKAQSMAWKYVT